MHYKNIQPDNIWYYDANGNYTEEEWKDIPKYKGLYRCSILGRIIRADRNRVLKQFIRKEDGYLSVNLCKGGIFETKTVHVLVMLVFKGKRPKGNDIHHRDHDRLNNMFTNLIYCTHGYNIKAAFDAGRKSLKCDKNPRATFTDQQVLEIVKLRKIKKLSYSKIAVKYNSATSTIFSILNGTNWASLTGIVKK